MVRRLNFQKKLDTEEERILKQRKKEVQQNLNLMDEVLKKIERSEDKTADEDSAFDENGNLKPLNALTTEPPQEKFFNPNYGYLNPQANNLPLFRK